MNDSPATWSSAIAPSWPPSASVTQGSSWDWEAPCEAMFEHLAAQDPDRLLALAATLPSAQLTHAAEWIGRSVHPRAWQALTAMLRHKSPLVREGAIIGLEALGLEALERAKNLLVDRALEDQEASPGVRAAAQDALMLLALG